MVRLELATPGLQAIELYSSKAIAGKELSFEEDCLSQTESNNPLKI